MRVVYPLWFVLMCRCLANLLFEPYHLREYLYVQLNGWLFPSAAGGLVVWEGLMLLGWHVGTRGPAPYPTVPMGQSLALLGAIMLFMPAVPTGGYASQR